MYYLLGRPVLSVLLLLKWLRDLCLKFKLLLTNNRLHFSRFTLSKVCPFSSDRNQSQKKLVRI